MRVRRQIDFSSFAVSYLYASIPVGSEYNISGFLPVEKCYVMLTVV